MSLALLQQNVANTQQIIQSIDIVDNVVHLPRRARPSSKSSFRQSQVILPFQTQIKVNAGTFESEPVIPEFLNGKTLGEAFVNSPEFKALQKGIAGRSMRSPFRTKSLYSGLPVGSPSMFGESFGAGIVPTANRRSRVRDLFPYRATDYSVVEFFRESGFSNNASVVPDYFTDSFVAALKSGLSFVGDRSPVRTLAHFEVAHRNVLEDEPQLRSIVDNELLYGLRLVEDAQILSGSGSGQDLRGILNTPGVQSYNWSAGVVGDTRVDAVRRAMSLVHLANFEPTGIIMHPSDWETIELTKDDDGVLVFAVSFASGDDSWMWNVPVVVTPVMPEGTVLVGAFGSGAQLYDREDSVVRVAEEHEGLFVENAVAVLAEQRLALAVKRPESFCAVNFDAPPGGS